MIIIDNNKRPNTSNKKMRNKTPPENENIFKKSFETIKKEKNLTLDKIWGNNFKVLNNNENGICKNENFKNLEIFNIMESENEGDSRLTSKYQTKNIKLPYINSPKKKIITKEQINLKKVNLNDYLPSNKNNKLFYSTEFNFNLKEKNNKYLEILNLKEKIIKKTKQSTKRKKVITTQNFFKNNKNFLPQISKNNIKNINQKKKEIKKKSSNRHNCNIFNINAHINFTNVFN